MVFLDYMIEHNRYLNVCGILVILAIAFAFSRNKRKINYLLVANGLLMQLVIGFFVLRTQIGIELVSTLAQWVKNIYEFADSGLQFVFGNLATQDGPWGFVFAIQVLPVIIFFGALTSLFFYYGIIQRVVSLINWVIRPILGTSGAETLCAIANSFLGQTEAPLLVRHYLKNMTKSELLVVMVSGMATISGAILVVFGRMGVPINHLLAASVMGIPASLIIAKILLPETQESQTASGAEVSVESPSANVFDAISQGTIDGLQLALNVAAMLISFVALMAMINALLGYVSYTINYYAAVAHYSWSLPVLSVEYIFSYLFAPFGYLLGFTGDEARSVGELIGIKVSLNEVIAYSQMVKMNLSDRAINIVTYALCGFSNFSCIGIQIGGIGALVPEKRLWLTQLGLYALLGGTLANLLSAMIAGILL